MCLEGDHTSLNTDKERCPFWVFYLKDILSSQGLQLPTLYLVKQAYILLAGWKGLIFCQKIQVWKSTKLKLQTPFATSELLGSGLYNLNNLMPGSV